MSLKYIINAFSNLNQLRKWCRRVFIVLQSAAFELIPKIVWEGNSNVWTNVRWVFFAATAGKKVIVWPL